MNTKTSLLKTNSLLGFILLSLSLLMPQISHAQAQQETETKPLKIYDIEIILFKNLKVPKGFEKILPSQAPLLDDVFVSFANQIDIEAAAEHGFSIPQDNEIRLQDLVEKINVSTRYQLLKHMTWRQPGLHKDHAIAVQIRTGDIFGNEYSSIDNPVTPLIIDEITDINDIITLDNPSLTDVNLPVSNAVTEINPTETNLTNSEELTEEPKLVWYELEGKITISLSRYLHAKVDLVLRIPNENELQFTHTIETKPIDATPIETNTVDGLSNDFLLSSSTLNNYALIEQRRMRSRKLHYIDHPEMGMLILITPYEEPTEIEFIEDINIL